MSNETASNSSVTATAVPLISEVKERQMTTENTESPVFLPARRLHAVCELIALLNRQDNSLQLASGSELNVEEF